ncbi:MAG: insulinase family protein [Thermoanaerobaculaceae bacterium]|nr:insulinase family protein [Thermoanaerobaculaceae bacterium]
MKKIYSLLLLAVCLFSLNLFGEENYRAYPIDFKDGNFGELQNGMRYYIINSNSELVHILVYINAGTNCEDQTNKGISALTLETVARVALKSMAGKKIRDISNEMPFSFSINKDINFAVIEMTVLKDDLEKFLDVIKEILFNATITENEVEDAKNYLKNFALQKKYNAGNKVQQELFKLLYGEYTAEAQELSSASYSKLSLKDVNMFYKKYYIPANCYIGVSSSLPAENVEMLVKGKFAQVSGGKEENCPISDKPDNESIVLILQKTGLEKSIVGVGKKLNLPQGDQLVEDLPILELALTIVYSDSPSARLIKQFKVERNLSDLVNLSFFVSNNPKKGYFLVFAYPESKKVGFSAYIVGRVFADLITNPPKGEELNQGKMALLANLNYNSSDPSLFLKTNMEFIIRGFSPNYVKKYSQILSKATTDDLVRICRDYFSMKKYQYVIYGSGENFSREMDVFGKVVMRNASIEE